MKRRSYGLRPIRMTIRSRNSNMNSQLQTNEGRLTQPKLCHSRSRTKSYKMRPADEAILFTILNSNLTLSLRKLNCCRMNSRSRNLTMRSKSSDWSSSSLNSPLILMSKTKSCARLSINSYSNLRCRPEQRSGIKMDWSCTQQELLLTQCAGLKAKQVMNLHRFPWTRCSHIQRAKRVNVQMKDHLMPCPIVEKQ